MRKSAAHLLRESSNSLDLTQAAGGWKNRQTVERHYAKQTNSMMNKGHQEIYKLLYQSKKDYDHLRSNE